jgi:hypothetical protein
VQNEAFFFFSVQDPSRPSLLLLSGDPWTRKEARLRASSPQGAWSPAAREAAAVKRWRRAERCGSLREREGCGKAGSKRVDCAVKGNNGLTLGKRIFFVDALFLITPLRSRLSVKSVKIGASDDFLRASEARSLQRFPRSFRNLNSRDS